MDITIDSKNAFVVDTGSVALKVKKIILDDVMKGVAKSETDKRVSKVVDAFLANVKNRFIKERYAKTIANNYIKWYACISLSLGAIKKFERANERLIKASGTKGFEGALFNFPTRNYLTSGALEAVRVENYRKGYKEALGKIIEEFAKEEFRETKGGTLRNYAEIRVRFEANKDDLDRMRGEGVRYVWASSHANCSPRCFPWQGKLYSLGGSSGSVDGISFSPIEEAMRGEKNDGNGLLGYNCRHRLIPYFEGSTPPKDFSEAEVKKQYALDKEQRQMERDIRLKKEEAHLLRGVDSERSKKLFKEAKADTEDYRKFSEEHSRPAYIYRTQVTREEIARNKGLQSAKLDDIIGTNTKEGIAVKSVSKHAQMRIIDRSVNERKIIDALTTPMFVAKDKIDENGAVSRKYIGKDATVMINPNTGNVITTHITGESKRRKYGKHQNEV